MKCIGLLRNTLGQVYHALGAFEKAEAMHREALRLRKTVLGHEHQDVAESLNNLSVVLWDQKRRIEAEVFAREALAMRRKLLGNDHLDIATTLDALVAALEGQTKLAEAETVAREALTMRRKHLGKMHPDVATSLDSLAWVLRRRNRLAEAESLDREALEIRRALLGREHPKVANLLQNLADVLQRQGKLAEAETSLREALAMHKKLLGDEHPEVNASLRKLANVLLAQGKLAEAELYTRERLSIGEKGEPGWQLSNARSALGDILRAQGKYAEAEPLLLSAYQGMKLLTNQVQEENLTLVLQRLVQLYEATGWSDKGVQWIRGEVERCRSAANLGDTSDLKDLARLARVLAEQGKLDEAETVAREALAMSRALFPQDQPSRAALLDSLALALKGEGKLTEAETITREALEIRTKLHGNEDSRTVQSRNNLVNLLGLQGKWAEAVSVLREVATGGSGNAQVLNNLAWFLATCPDPKVRDGPSAVAFAEKAVARNEGNAGYVPDTLAAAYAEAGQFTNAVKIQKEAIALLRNKEEKEDYASRLRLYESGSPFRDDGLLARRTSALLADGKFAEAEPVARECLALREKQIPDDWLTCNARSVLGGCLLGQKKYAEAEPLLLSAYEGMKQREAKIPAVGKPRLKEALERLVQLYDATGRSDQAAEWKQKLAAFEKAESTNPPAAPPPK